MFKALRTRITPATVIATLALILAMTGGAYAAGHYLITSTKQISPTVLKALKGKAGPAGPAGAGTAGPAGPQGPAGPKGENGTNGNNGAPGANGTSVTSSESAGAIEGHCNGTTSGGKGGSKFESASGKTYACNGKEGSPWTAGGILPTGKTEEGQWSATLGPAGLGTASGSFVIPLSAAPSFVYITEEEETGGVPKTHETECPGTHEAPSATEGFLCVYTGSAVGTSLLVNQEHPFGFYLLFEGPSGQVAFGSWAVTAG